jgi:hypothetical protein
LRATVHDAENEFAAWDVGLRFDGAPKAFAYAPDTDRPS